MGAGKLLAAVGAFTVLCVGGLLVIANREFGGNINSSHVALLQVGVAMVAAVGARRLLRWKHGALVFAVLVGLGVTVNNLYLDIFFDSARRQAAFWQRFEQQYPVLPDPPMFFMDVQDGAVWSDLRTYCDFESHLRHRYGVRAVVDTKEQAVNDAKAGKLIRGTPYWTQTHLGPEYFDPTQMTVVR